MESKSALKSEDFRKHHFHIKVVEKMAVKADFNLIMLLLKMCANPIEIDIIPAVSLLNNHLCSIVLISVYFFFVCAHGKLNKTFSLALASKDFTLNSNQEVAAAQ